MQNIFITVQKLSYLLEKGFHLIHKIKFLKNCLKSTICEKYSQELIQEDLETSVYIPILGTYNLGTHIMYSSV